MQYLQVAKSTSRYYLTSINIEVHYFDFGVMESYLFRNSRGCATMTLQQYRAIKSFKTLCKDYKGSGQRMWIII